ncbi:MAG: 3-oxoacyl-ACP reductase family protein [Candidatus Krumholzibacteriia bacterium]
MPGASAALLANRTALITGSSRGIGAAVARLMALHGARVAVNYCRSEAKARVLRDEITEAGGEAIVVCADVTSPDQIECMFAEVKEAFGPVNILVNNASISFPITSFVELRWDDFIRKLTDELRAAFHCCRHAVDHMTESGGGSIINVSSALSRHPGHGFAAHSSAKAALDAFSRDLAVELGPQGIRVNVVAPGLTLTDATAYTPDDLKEAIAMQTPLQRLGLPDDISGTVVYLASDLSAFVTGAYIPVSGGIQMI